jgi:hypothetical protein
MDKMFVIRRSSQTHKQAEEINLPHPYDSSVLIEVEGNNGVFEGLE